MRKAQAARCRPDANLVHFQAWVRAVLGHIPLEMEFIVCAGKLHTRHAARAAAKNFTSLISSCRCKISPGTSLNIQECTARLANSGSPMQMSSLLGILSGTSCHVEPVCGELGTFLRIRWGESEGTQPMTTWSRDRLGRPTMYMPPVLCRSSTVSHAFVRAQVSGSITMPRLGLVSHSLTGPSCPVLSTLNGCTELA